MGVGFFNLNSFDFEEKTYFLAVDVCYFDSKNTGPVVLKSKIPGIDGRQLNTDNIEAQVLPLLLETINNKSFGIRRVGESYEQATVIADEHTHFFVKLIVEFKSSAVLPIGNKLYFMPAQNVIQILSIQAMKENDYKRGTLKKKVLPSITKIWPKNYVCELSEIEEDSHLCRIL